VTPAEVRELLHEWTRRHAPTRVRGYIAGPPQAGSSSARATARSVEVALAVA
jgi:hypothetical protein